jgi:hypothetical protein
MIYAFLVAAASIGGEAHFARMTAPDRFGTGVLLVDANAFGVQYEAAKMNYRTAVLHNDKMERKMEIAFPAWVGPWQSDMIQRRIAWRMLMQALDESSSDERRLDDLDTLRGIIGDEAYFLGVMPMPFPSYEKTIP